MDGVPLPDESMDTQQGGVEMEGGDEGGDGGRTFAGEPVPFDEQ